MTCKCGYSTDENKMCNGTHKIVKKVREDLAIKTQEWINSKELWTNEELINFIRIGKDNV